MSDAPRHVIAAVPDLMDRSRLGGATVAVTSVSVGRLAAAVADAERVDLVVVDLSRPGAVEAAAGLGLPVVGFAPHVDDTLIAAARVAGIEALPRSVFFRRWPDVGPASG